MSEAGKPLIEVACGVLVNATGEVLLAQRPEGKIAAGWWEFPGGKIERGESALQALSRELHEELGVSVQQASPLIRFRHEYSNRVIVLDTWRVTAFDGEPRSCEGQALRWLPVDRFAEVTPLLPTVVPIERALRTPAHYVFTPPGLSTPDLLAGLPQLPRGAWLRLRLPSLGEADYARLLHQVLPAAQACGIKVLLDRDPAQVTASGAATHPGAPTLGWDGFGHIRRDAPLPVFAIGGVGPGQWNKARAANAQGLAGISAYWS